MKIQGHEQTLHPFSAVGQGVVFRVDHVYYLKPSTAILTEDPHARRTMETGESHFKAVRLSDGALCNFKHETQVLVFPDSTIYPGREEA